MRFRHLLIAVAILAVDVLLVPASGLAQSTAQHQVSAESFVNIGTSFEFQSGVMESVREINVRVPASYSSTDQGYNVLYVIDGGLEQDFLHIAGLAQLASVNLDYEELIVVGIRTENRFMELTHEPQDPRYVEDPPRTGKSEQFYRHLTEEVVALVESRFRVGDRKALVGESLAGLFVAEVFLTHPHSFTDYICISPSLWWDDRALARRSATLLAGHDETQRRLYLTMANEGGTMQDGLDRLIESLKSNSPAGLDWHFVDRSLTHTHATIYHPAVHDALNHLFDTPHPEPTETPWYLIEGGQPPELDR
ncbi:MAG: alpha/beta hydrolase-fold protein [Planctomycetota bacterium]